MLRGFWGQDTTKVKYSKIDFATIKSLLSTPKCYDSYIGFNCDSVKLDDKISLKKIDTFSLKEPCYSKPLFRKLLATATPTDATFIEFAKAKDLKRNRFTVIFRYKSTTKAPVLYFDITVWPRFIEIMKKK